MEPGRALWTPLDLLTPEPQFASGIVSFTHENPEWLSAQLVRQRVVVWAGMAESGSVHRYNDRSDALSRASTRRSDASDLLRCNLTAASPDTSVSRNRARRSVRQPLVIHSE